MSGPLGPTVERLALAEKVASLERAYGEPWERWYHPFALKALEGDEERA